MLPHISSDDSEPATCYPPSGGPAGPPRLRSEY